LANHIFLPAVPYGYNARERLATLGEYHFLTIAHPLHETGEMLVCLAQTNWRPLNLPCSHVTTLVTGQAKDQLWLRLALDSLGRRAEVALRSHNALVDYPVY
jgi:hypothetical protein